MFEPKLVTHARHARLGVALALLALVAFVAAGAARGASPSAYSDPAGDSSSAPDIQAVTLTDNGDGTVGFRIDLAATIPDDGSSAVCVLIDADRNGATGSEVGYEYGVMADATGLSLVKWDGAHWSGFDHRSPSPRLDGGVMTFVLTLADLGTTSFDFVVGGINGDDIDMAPDHGVFTYPSAPPASTQPAAPATAAAPAPAPVVTPAAVAKPTISMVIVGGWAFGAKAGKTFAVPAPQVRLSDDETVAADTYSCTLKNHGAPLKPVRKCTWKLAKATKGKKLTLKINVGYQGQTGSVTIPVVPG